MKSYSLIDLLLDIVDICTTSNDNKTTPYDVLFTNHYKILYNVEEEHLRLFKSKLEIKQIIQDRRSKCITVYTGDCQYDDSKFTALIEFFNNNDIDYSLNGNSISYIKIYKKTKGVLDEREWKT